MKRNKPEGEVLVIMSYYIIMCISFPVPFLYISSIFRKTVITIFELIDVFTNSKFIALKVN
jgi:hypothetical protein